MRNKFLFAILVSPSILWLIRPNIYSPWYVENLLGSPTVIFLVYLITLIVLLKWLSAKIILSALLINMTITTYVLFKEYIPQSPTSKCSNALSIFQLNNKYDEKNIKKLSSYLSSNSYDLVSLQEITPNSRKQLINQLSPTYPYFVTGIAADFSMTTDQLVLSKYQFSHIKYFGQKPASFLIEMQWQIDEELIHVFTLHPPSPRTEILWKTRNQTFYQLLSQIKLSSNKKILVVGDFNLSSFSPRIELLKMVPITKYVGSWPNYFYIPSFFSLAIDHVFTSPSLNICSRKIIKAIDYSDHYPIFTKVTF